MLGVSLRKRLRSSTFELAIFLIGFDGLNRFHFGNSWSSLAEPPRSHRRASLVLRSLRSNSLPQIKSICPGLGGALGRFSTCNE